MTEPHQATAQHVAITDDTLTHDITDRRSIAVPLTWHPRLIPGTPAEREPWRFIGQGEGIHWPVLDADIKVAHVLAGRPSQES